MLRDVGQSPTPKMIKEIATLPNEPYVLVVQPDIAAAVLYFDGATTQQVFAGKRWDARHLVASMKQDPRYAGVRFFNQRKGKRAFGRRFPGTLEETTHILNP